jgi:hypothetical protein
MPACTHGGGEAVDKVALTKPSWCHVLRRGTGFRCRQLQQDHPLGLLSRAAERVTFVLIPRCC